MAWLAAAGKAGVERVTVKFFDNQSLANRSRVDRLVDRFHSKSPLASEQATALVSAILTLVLGTITLGS
jgi:hypothetical protein